MSTITFLAYRTDKTYALTSTRRISEATLHALELFGGWPGAFIAQRGYHHKTKKLSYQAVFLLIIVIHIVALLYAGFIL